MTTNEAKPHTLAEFEQLIDQCKKQVVSDPDSYLDNPHLYDILHRVYLRLCHGNIPEFRQ